jgi:hypothetical protein
MVRTSVQVHGQWLARLKHHTETWAVSGGFIKIADTAMEASRSTAGGGLTQPR